MSHVILLIDDEPYLLNALSRALRHEAFRILTARTADESIDILKAHTIDLVVSDQNMPGMAGTEFLAWVAEHFPEIPRIMLTGSGDARVREQAMEESRVDYFFVKPFDAEKLAAAIRRALDDPSTKPQLAWRE